MSGTSGEPELDPIVQPRLVRFLKDRQRLIDRGIRKELLEQLESQMVMRRRPDTAAEMLVDNMFERFREAGTEVSKKRVRDRLKDANKGPLRDV